MFFAISTSQSRLLARAVAVVCLVMLECLSVGVAAAYPEELQRLFDLAEQEFFDGNFDAATQQIQEARAWIGEPKNREILAKEGFKWSAVSKNVLAFDAAIATEQGELVRAKILFESALKSLKDMNLKGYAALVHIAAGDFEFCQVFPALEPAKLPQELQPLLSDRTQNLKRAKKHYDDADKVIKCWNKDNDFGKRMQARVEHGLGRCAMVEGEISKAKRHFQEAEAKFRDTDSFEEIIAPGVKWPKSLQQVQKALDANSAIKPQLKHQILSDYSRIITEWLRFQCDHAELEALHALKQGGGKLQFNANAEKVFRKARDLFDENLPAAHAARFRIDISQANFYLRMANEAAKLAAAEMPGLEKDRLLAAERSFFLDAAFVAQDTLALMRRRVQLGEMKDSHPLLIEALLLELAAHNAGFPLAGRGRENIIADLQARMAPPKADQVVGSE